MRLSVYQNCLQKMLAEPQHGATVARPSRLQHFAVAPPQEEPHASAHAAPRRHRRCAFTRWARSASRCPVRSIRQPQSSRGGNRLKRVIRACDSLKLRWVIRPNRVAFLEVGRQLKMGQVLPIFGFREKLPIVFMRLYAACCLRSLF